MFSRSVCIFAGVALLLAGLGVSADETAVKGRAVFDANKEAVVTVRTAITMSYGGKENETINEGNGTVIAPDGLTILSLTSVDPTSFYESMRESGGELAAKITSIKILVGEDTEIEAEVVLRDKELDLVFVRPTKKLEQPMAFVDLAASAEPQILDEVVILAQLGKVARRTHSVTIARIEGVMDKPRTFYLFNDYLSHLIVCSPVFTLEGQFVGIGVLRAIKGQDGIGISDNVLAVVVPAQDIKEGVAQVPPFGEKAPEPAPETPAAPSNP